jgi:translation initiation factor 2 subunit 3
MQLKNLLIVQTKIDLIGKSSAENHREQITKFIQGKSLVHFSSQLSVNNSYQFSDTNAVDAPIIPISAQFNANLDTVCDYLVRKIPIPIRDFTSSPRMTSKRREYIYVQ